MNGKVRIYELSKELNLDNKDILAIASRLDIAVKSHSSTIAESEADQIRSAARQARANGGPNRPDRPRPAAPIKNGARPERKQQILEIRRHRVTPKADTETATPPVPSAPAPVAQDRPARPSPDNLSKPPSRPGVEVTARTSEPDSQPKPPAPNRPTAPAAPVEVSTAPEASTETVERPVAPPPAKPKPELVSPVSRSRPELDERPADAPEAVRPPRPVIRRDRSAAPPDRPTEGSARPTIPIREIDADEDVPRLKPKPKLRRPNADAETARAETAPPCVPESPKRKCKTRRIRI